MTEVCHYFYAGKVFFYVVQLEVHFVIHGLGVRIVAKFVLYKLRLFTAGVEGPYRKNCVRSFVNGARPKGNSRLAEHFFLWIVKFTFLV